MRFRVEETWKVVYEYYARDHTDAVTLEVPERGLFTPWTLYRHTPSGGVDSVSVDHVSQEVISVELVEV